MILSQFDPTKPICWDVETISYDDNRGGLLPYHGDRVAGVSLVQKGAPPLYLPLRHRTDVEGCMPFEFTINALRELAANCLIVPNLNVKFDLKCLIQDNIVFNKNCIFEDLGTLARIVHNQLQSYSLESLANLYNKEHKKEADLIKAWNEEHGTKDYGRAPIELMGKYAIKDGFAALELRDRLLEKMPADSMQVWQEECRFTRTLFNCEHAGFEVDQEFLKAISYALALKMDKLKQEIDKIAGHDLNPASHDQVNDYFMRAGVQPVVFNKQEDGSETPSWNSDALSQIIHPMSNLLIDYNEAKIALSTFAQGWLERVAPDGKIHPSFYQSGTRTGRISSRDPNLQNPPKWILRAIRIPDGKVGVKFDYSQIEYRIFAHYSEDPELLRLYAENPETDFHQIIADRLAMGDFRDMVKPINFGILYGMGKKKMKKQLAKTMHDLHEKMSDEDYGEFMMNMEQRYGGRGGGLEAIGESIINEYHRLNPAVKRLLNEVKRIIAVRGNIRNFYRRYFQFSVDKAYVALNYLCQGSAADLFKSRVNAIFFDEAVQRTGAEMVTNIHDSVFANVPEEAAQEYWERVRVLATQVDLKIPILIDGEVALGHWGNIASKEVKGKKKPIKLKDSVGELVCLLKSQNANESMSALSTIMN